MTTCAGPAASPIIRGRASERGCTTCGGLSAWVQVLTQGLPVSVCHHVSTTLQRLFPTTAARQTGPTAALRARRGGKQGLRARKGGAPS